MHCPSCSLIAQFACAGQAFESSELHDQHADRRDSQPTRRIRRIRGQYVCWGQQCPQLTGQGGSLIQPYVWLVSRGAEPPLHYVFVGRFGGVHCIALLFIVCMGAVSRAWSTGTREIALSCSCCASQQSALHCCVCCRTTQCMLMQASLPHPRINGIRRVARPSGTPVQRYGARWRADREYLLF